MENISLIVIIGFIATSITTVFLFLKASGYNKTAIVVITGLIIIQSVLGGMGFFTHWEAVPPRFLFLIAPGLLITLLLMTTSKGKIFIDALDLPQLTLLHTIRIPIEMTLYYLSVAALIPVSMTFAGHNYDILSGMSAPIIYYLVFWRKRMGTRGLLIWNVLCLVLLVIIVTTAVLAAKTPFQQIDFDQPNIGIGYFPFVLLPGIVVPLVLISHLAAIRQLMALHKTQR
jgi:hypothetical protein